MKTKHLFTTLLAGLMVVAMTACGSTLASTTTEYEDNFDNVLISSDAIPTETTVQGDAGENVEALQKYLIALGFLDDVADGQFGENTKNAIINFQKTYGITVTGEADEETLDMLTMLVDSIATEPEDGGYALTMFRSINILRYDDGKYYVEPNTVSDKTFESAEAALKAVIESFQASTMIPADDTRVLLAVNNDVASDIIYESDFIADWEDNYLDINLLKKLASKNDGVSITDIDGNVVVFDSEGNISSDTGNIVTRVVDYDDIHVIISETASNTIEDAFNVEMVVVDDGTFTIDEDLDEEDTATENITIEDTFIFRNINISKMSDESYMVEQNTVSDKTLDEFRKAYTAIRYAYLHSTEIPVVDKDTRIKVDIDNLPENITANDLSQDDDGNYYIPVRELQEIANRFGNPVVVTDTDGNNVTVTDLGTVQSDTGDVVSQDVNIQTGESITEFETRPTEEVHQPETRPSTPVMEIPNEVEVPIPVVNEPETQKPAEPATERQVEQPTEHIHSWVELTTTIHHDAVTHTVNHPAQTHEETVYTTIHHDATYKMVHHDAVTHEEPIYETIGWTVCGRCGAKVDVTKMTKEEFRSWCYDGHGNCPGNGSLSNVWEDVVVGYQTVTDSNAWDEQVVDTPAWDEQVANDTKTVVDSEAWVETVTDKAAWDEVVVTGYKCSECGTTK